MVKMRSSRILPTIRQNTTVHTAHGSLRSSQVYWNTETHLRPLPPHPWIAIQTQLSVVHLFRSAHQLAPIKARVLSELRPPRRPSLPACNNNSLDYRLRRKQPSLKSSVYSHNKLPVPHSSNAQQQMCRTLPPPPPTRTANELLTSIHDSMRSRLSYLVLRPQHKTISNVFIATSTTYITEDENGIRNTNDDLLASRNGLVSSSCAPSCHHRNVRRYR